MANQIYDGNPQAFAPLWEEGYSFKLGQYINRGWELFRPHAWQFIGYGVLMTLMSMVGGFIPLLGYFIQAALQAILITGIYHVSRKIARNESIEFGDFFKGFDDLMQLGLTGIVRFLIMFVPVAVVAVIIFLSLGLSFSFFDGAQDLEPVALIPLIGGMFLIMAYLMYLGVSYVFAEPLVHFERLEFWPALETSRKIITKNWWSFLLMFLFVGLLYIAGILLFIVGIFAAIPLAYCIMYAAFEDIVGDQEGGIYQKIDEIGIQVDQINDFDDV